MVSMLRERELIRIWTGTTGKIPVLGRRVLPVAGRAFLATVLALFFAPTAAQGQSLPANPTQRLELGARYVNNDDQLISPAELRQLLKIGNRRNPKGQLHWQVTKPIPVYLKLGMDQRHIVDLLTACANSNPPIEIRNYRVSRSSNRTENHDMNVEIFGIIHIFNPVNDEVLKLETARARRDREHG